MIRLLDLHIGDKIIFCLNSGRMYLYKDNSDDRGLRLKGRSQQLSAQSVDTVRSVLTSVEGITPEHLHSPLELTVFNRLTSITVDGVSHPAVNIINRL